MKRAADRPRAQPDDETLFERFRERRDGAALAALFDRMAPDLFRAALYLVHNVADAEDLVQETFLTAIEHAQDYQGHGNVGGWLGQILVHRARRLQRQLRRRPRAGPRGEAPDPRRTAEDREAWLAVERAVAALPEAYRTTLVLHLRYGHKPGEIADALGEPPGTVRSRLARGLDLLRKALPKGLTLAAMGSFLPRGLAAVRSLVLAQAAAGTASNVTLLAVAGGIAMKKAILGVCALAALGLVPLVVRIDLGTSSAGAPAASKGSTADFTAAAPIPSEPARAPAAAEATLASDPVGLVLHGRLSDRQGNVLAVDAILNLFAIEGQTQNPLAGFSDEHGYGVVGLAPGRWKLLVRARGYRELRRELTLPASPRVQHLDLVLEEETQIAVHLVTPEGEPLQRAFARAGYEPHPRGVTVLATLEDPGPRLAVEAASWRPRLGVGRWLEAGTVPEQRPASARYGTLLLDRPQAFWASAVLGSAVLARKPVAAGATEVTLEVSVASVRGALVTIRWQVADEAGRPFTDGRASFGDGTIASQGSLPVAADGRVVLAGRLPGPQRLLVGRWQYAGRLFELDPQPGQDLDLGLVRLEPANSLRGRVLDEAGAPVARAELTWWTISGTPSMSESKSGKDGEFELRELPVGRVRVRASARGFAPTLVELGASRGKAEGAAIRLRRGQAVQVVPRFEGVRELRVFDARGELLITQHVSPDSWPAPTTFQLAPGRYAVKVYRGDGLRQQLALDVGDQPAVLEVVD